MNRLRPFLDRMISPVQGAFVPGRLASDNVVVAQEILHTIRKRKKGGGLALKVDIAKAYDTVNWDFLKETISAFGFPKVLINLIMNYLSKASLSVVWNGQVLSPIAPKRGLRQGDPISPYLFVLCMERLSLLVNQRVEQGLWKPIKVANSGPHVSHLLFADDVILFTWLSGKLWRNSRLYQVCK